MFFEPAYEYIKAGGLVMGESEDEECLRNKSVGWKEYP